MQLNLHVESAVLASGVGATYDNGMAPLQHRCVFGLYRMQLVDRCAGLLLVIIAFNPIVDACCNSGPLLTWDTVCLCWCALPTLPQCLPWTCPSARHCVVPVLDSHHTMYGLVTTVHSHRRTACPTVSMQVPSRQSQCSATVLWLATLARYAHAVQHLSAAGLAARIAPPGHLIRSANIPASEPRTVVRKPIDFKDGDDDSVKAHWALLIAGSAGWGNYRHQADVCHSYQVLRRGGLRADHIVVMMYDDIASNFENPVPGKIFNRPGEHLCCCQLVILLLLLDVTAINL